MKRFTLSPLLFTFTVACGSGAADGGHGHTGSGAVCPAENAPTYATFGRSFLTTYCTGCHASTVRPSDRQGAPSDVSFDTLDLVRRHARGIDEHAAAGPAAINAAMPPKDPRPSLDERTRLGAWLACGAP